MKPTNDIQTLFPDLQIRTNEPLNRHTTFGLGGPCPLLVDNPPAARLPALIQALNEKGVPLLVIGQGSNLVIADAGLDCAVIRFCSETPKIRRDGRRVIVSGDTLLDDLARITVEQAAGDLSYCTGIPGTVGGGLARQRGRVRAADRRPPGLGRPARRRRPAAHRRPGGAGLCLPPLQTQRERRDCAVGDF